MLKSVLLLCFLLVQFSFIGRFHLAGHKRVIPESEQRWVDSVFATLSDDEKVGQLYMIRAHSDKGPEHIAEVEAQIKKYHIGGLCFFQGTPLKQAELTNQYQQMSRIPMMVAIDAEFGLGMRHKEAAISFPKMLTLGALQDNKSIYDMGAEIAEQLKRIGCHINFAPVVDININPANPVINDRSFGENRTQVTAKAFQYMRGMQDHGIMASVKHFPGHGDTDVDSHLDLPLIPFSKKRLDSIELFPFRLLFEQGAESVMVSHLSVPALESDPKVPSTLSTATLTGLIRNELKFEGLIFSDAMEMKGVTKNYAEGEVEMLSFKAGMDVLCLPNNIDLSIQQLKQAIQQEPTLYKRLNQSVKKILHAKYHMGLHLYSPTPLSNLVAEVNNGKAKALKSKLYEQALTLVTNKNNLIPITDLDHHKLGSLSIGVPVKSAFQWRLDSYAKVSHLQSDYNLTEAKSVNLLAAFKDKDIVIVALHGLNKYIKQNFGLSQSAIQFIRQLSLQTKVILVSFGSPYALKNFEKFDWVLQAYEEDPIMQDLAAQSLFGAIGADGKLPVTVTTDWKLGTGISQGSLMRFGYSIPERVNINSIKLSALDGITEEIVQSHAAPGGQLLVAKDGKIIYQKSFGYHDYEKKIPVGHSDIYDIASITKVASSTLATMKLYDEGTISLDQPLAQYLPALKNSNKANITLTEIMSHQAGFIAWIPFYKETLVRLKRNKYKPDPTLYASTASSKYKIPVAAGMYLKTGYDELIWNHIVQSELRNNKNYLYSDLGFYMIAEMVKCQTGLRLDQYMNKNFYQPLGLTHTLYNPYKSYPLNMIAPTEKDNYWRNRTIKGYVHDMGAAMLDGVSGHAGLFSNATDLATIMQLLLSGGQYGGTSFIRPSTIKYFASRQLGSSRRGLGFDMKELDPNKPQPASYLASANLFGHTGFTGTAAWIDPDHQLVFVFLCNRTYPSMNNNKLHKSEYRSRLLDAVYHAMEDQHITPTLGAEIGQ